MIELTKDELKEIKRCLKYMINGGVTPYSVLTIEINKKIQSMIDEPCEHQGDEMIYLSNPPQNKCIKCGEFYR